MDTAEKIKVLTYNEKEHILYDLILFSITTLTMLSQRFIYQISWNVL